MTSYKKYIVPLLLVLIGLLGYSQYQHNVSLRSELSALNKLHESALAEINTRLDTLQSDFTALGTDWRLTRNGLNQSVVTMQSRLGALEEQVLPAAATPSESGMITEGDIGAGDFSASDFREARRAMLNSSKAQDLLATNGVENRYGAFIQSLDLSAAEDQALRSMLTAAMKRGYEFMQQLQSGEISQSRFNQLNRENFQNLEDAMAGLLSNEQMLAYRQYERDEPIRARANTEANNYVQLGIQAPGLTDTNRALVARVIADVMARPRSTVVPSGEYMPLVFEEAEQELQGTLDEDQLRIVSDYFKRTSDMMRLMAP